ncbi:aerotolerance regulator BatB, partial [Fusobacterium mortiferum]|nr:aerotolerance regulator BatB [Fusobacterium mortiferum]
MKFGNLQNIIYLIFPIILLLTMILGMKKRKDILKALKLKNKKYISLLKVLFLTLGALLVVLALLSPQKEIEDEQVEVKGMNIYVLIDTSRSMLTEDVYPNRLEAGKRVLA